MSQNIHPQPQHNLYKTPRKVGAPFRRHGSFRDNYSVFGVVACANQLVKTKPFCNIVQQKIRACADNNAVSCALLKPRMHLVDMSVPKFFDSFFLWNQRQKQKACFFERCKIDYMQNHQQRRHCDYRQCYKTPRIVQKAIRREK